jgi:hypothetical protein
MLILKSLEKAIKDMDFRTTPIVREKLESNKRIRECMNKRNGRGDSNVHW